MRRLGGLLRGLRNTLKGPYSEIKSRLGVWHEAENQTKMPELRHGEQGLRTDLNGHLWRGKPRAIQLKMEKRHMGQENVEINLSEIVGVCTKSNGPCDHGHLKGHDLSASAGLCSRSHVRDGP
jgi:uncharacterized protein YicC (UPF0701 family)